MCGRFVLTSDLKVIIEKFGIQRNEYAGYEKRFNIAPTQDIPAVITGQGGRVPRGFKWELIPFWSRNGKSSYSMINARAESIEKNRHIETCLTEEE